MLTDAVEDCLTHQRNADWSKIKLVIRDHHERIHLETDQAPAHDPAHHHGRVNVNKM